MGQVWGDLVVVWGWFGEGSGRVWGDLVVVWEWFGAGLGPILGPIWANPIFLIAKMFFLGV